jgi:hypothetical protein
MSKSSALPVLLVAYAAASLLHFVHNAEFVDEYPNMPAGLSRGMIYAAWLGVTAIGMAGYLLFRRGLTLAGVAFLAFYAALGFDALIHYILAPPSHHTVPMNLTIGFEVATAGLLLILVAAKLRRTGRKLMSRK